VNETPEMVARSYFVARREDIERDYQRNRSDLDKMHLSEVESLNRALDAELEAINETGEGERWYCCTR
jgi:hypothetical protein